MNYTIIGAEGFIGRGLSEHLSRSGHKVLAPRRGDPSLFNIDLGKIFYCAGLTADYSARPFDTVEAHVFLLAKLLKEAQFEHLVYLSSTRLYDDLSATVCTEESKLLLEPQNPRHLYDLSKALGENICLTVAPTRSSVARLACVYDWRTGSPGFLSNLLQQAALNQKTEINSGTGSVRDYIHRDDAVNAICAMMDQSVRGIVNVASGENLSNLELAEIFNRCGYHVCLRDITKRQSVPVCDIRRLLSLGIRPQQAKAVVEFFLNGGASNGIS